MQKYLNLVFQGGGVRGIAYAGALESLPADCQIHSVAGTSAGSIVAALLALKKTPAELIDILRDQELYQLVDTRTGDGGKILHVIDDAKKHFANGFGFWKVMTFYHRHAGAIPAITRALTKRGLFTSEAIRAWLDKHLGPATFSDIKIAGELQIVAADLRHCEYVVYTKGTHGGTRIAEAVQASISIPLFFEPTNKNLVDGGLLSNFPAFLFQDEQYPTIGLRLQDLAPADVNTSAYGFLRSLLATMVEAHDKRRGLPKDFVEFLIDTGDIRGTDFLLDESKVLQLLDYGRRTGRGIEWSKIASAKPAHFYTDRLPHRALHKSLSGAQQVWTQMESGSTWVECIEESIVFRVRVESDWSTHYSRAFELRVRGPRPLHVGRVVVADDRNRGVLQGTSLAEVQVHCFELMSDGKKVEQILVPALNERLRKGFLVFYDPPIRETDGPRTFETGFSLPEEFRDSLGRGNQDAVGLSLQQRADDHTITDLTVELWFHPALPQVAAKPRFSCTTAQATRAHGNDQYRVVTLKGRSKINALTSFAVELSV